MTEKYNVTIERKLGDEFVVTDDPAAQHQVGGAMLARAEARMIADQVRSVKGSGPAFVGTLIAERVEWYSRMLRAELAKYVTEHPAISGYFAPQAVEIMKSEAIRDPKGKLVGSISTKFSTAPKVS